MVSNKLKLLARNRQLSIHAGKKFIRITKLITEEGIL